MWSGDTRLGTLGQIHPDVCAAYGLDGATYCAEIDVVLLHDLEGAEPVYTPLPRFPAITRDIAVVCDEAVTVGAADSEGTGRSGKSGTGYYPHPVKPDLVVYDSPNGTSFSTPVVTGLCAALMGYRPMKRRELIRLLHASGTRSAAPDLETGYGIPQCDTLLGFLDTPAELQTLPLNATQ